MKKVNKSITFVIFFCILSSYLAFSYLNEAEIEGEIYDSYLRPLEKAVIYVNTTPPQVIVISNYTYKIKVLPGEYSIIVKIPTEYGLINVYEEKIVINAPGVYYYDIILPPEKVSDLLNEDSLEIDSFNLDKDKNIKNNNIYISYYLIISIFLILIVIFVLYKVKKVRKEVEKEVKKLETNSEIELVIETIKKYGGRIKQRDLAKALNMSKSKLSLILSEMEAKGIIKKYKKGRGNIIVLNS